MNRDIARDEHRPPKLKPRTFYLATQIGGPGPFV